MEIDLATVESAERTEARRRAHRAVRRVQNARVAGVLEGLMHADSAVRSGGSATAPAVLSVPARFDTQTLRQEFARGYEEGWQAIAGDEPGSDWCTDLSEVTQFAHVLYALEMVDGVEGVLDYFDKPWKWAREFHLWAVLERPTPGVGGPVWEALEIVGELHDL